MPKTFSIAEQSIHFLTRDHVGPTLEPVSNTFSWRGADLSGRPEAWRQPVEDWVFEEFEVAARAHHGRDLRDVDLADLRTPGLEKVLENLEQAISRGLGFTVLRGVPVGYWPAATTELFLWAVAQGLGTPGVQNPRGDLIGRVSDTGADERDPMVRNYATNREFRFHCDAADAVGLLCIRPARRGGTSKVASSVTVFNELLRLRPDLAARMFEPMLLDARNEQPEGIPPYAPVVPLAYDGEQLRTFYISDYFRSVERFDDVELDRAACELFDLYEELAGSEEIGLRFELEPGDFEVLNNHVMLHARDEFEDDPGDPGRLLLRILVSRMTNSSNGPST